MLIRENFTGGKKIIMKYWGELCAKRQQEIKKIQTKTY